MADALAGNFVRAEDHVDTLVADINSDATIGTASTGFSAVSQIARTALGGKLVYMTLELTRTGADLVATAGNVADTACFTVDPEYRPSEVVNTVLGANMVGEVILNTSGVVTIRAASDTLASGVTFRCTFAFLKA